MGWGGGGVVRGWRGLVIGWAGKKLEEIEDVGWERGGGGGLDLLVFTPARSAQSSLSLSVSV